MVAAACVAGCGGGSDTGAPEPRRRAPTTVASETRPGAIPLAAPPPALSDLCRSAAAASQLACPGLIPARGDLEKLRPMRMSPDTYPGYLLNLNVSAFRGDDLGHVLLGAQPHPLALTGAAGEPWPRRRADAPDAELRIPARTSGPRARRLTVLRTVRVGEADGLVVRSPPLPAGGVHARHVILLWNLAGHGYAVSIHLTNERRPDRYSERERIRGAVRMARSYIPYSG